MCQHSVISSDQQMCSADENVQTQQLDRTNHLAEIPWLLRRWQKNHRFQTFCSKQAEHCRWQRLADRRCWQLETSHRHTAMEVIQTITEGKVQHVPVIMASPSKSSSLDLIPTFLLKEVINILLTVHNGNLLCNCLAGDAKVTIHQLEACMAGWKPTSCTWTYRRHNWSGWALGSILWSSTGHRVDVCKYATTVNCMHPWHHWILTMGDHVSAACRACYFSCVNCWWLCSFSHQRWPRHTSTPSSVDALTTVMHVYMA